MVFQGKKSWFYCERGREGGNQPWGCHWWLQGHAPFWWQNKNMKSSKKVSTDQFEYFLPLWWEFNLAIVMSARVTHSCFGMEKNSTDLGSNCFVELSSQDGAKKSCCFLYLRALLSASTPPATKIPSSSSSLSFVASFKSSSYVSCGANKILRAGICICLMHNIIEISGPLSCWDKTREKVWKQEV